MNANHLGISVGSIEKITDSLNTLLSSYQIHYQNLRGLHWNIKGPGFFELHLKYEEYYNDAQIKIDEIAERVLTLGGIPKHSFEDYVSGSVIKSKVNISDGKEGVALIADSVTELLKLEKELIGLASEANDDGTTDLMTQFVSQQEKELWMLRSWLNI